MDSIQKEEKLGRAAVTGSLLAAILSSACCWLPLGAVLFGASAAGVGSFFEAWRPWFLGISALFLAISFYFLYLRRARCAPGSACAVPHRKAQAFSKGMFWVSVVLIGAFAFFPDYIGSFLGGKGQGSLVAAPAEATEYRFDIEGMTCEGCASNVHNALTGVPGVFAAEVALETKKAIVKARPEVQVDALLKAVQGAGYSARLEGSPMNRPASQPTSRPTSRPGR